MHTHGISQLIGSSQTFSSKQQLGRLENDNGSNLDKVVISEGGALLNRLDDFMDSAGKDGAITLDEIVAFRDKSLERAEQEIRDTLRKLHINPGEALQFDVSPYGILKVTGSTQSVNEALSTALQDNDAFMQSYAAASASGSTAAALEAAIPFHRDYAIDAKSAVEKYSWLFNKKWSFSMSYENGKTSHKVA